MTYSNKLTANKSLSHDGGEQALALFQRAAQEIPAYGHFLANHGIDASDIKTIDDFKSVPYTDKDNYVHKYPLKDLCWGGDLGGLSYIVSSSGSTGVPQYWPRGDQQDQLSLQVHKHVLQTSLGLDNEPTLIVNSYGQGTWIAGTELYNSARLLAKEYPNLAIINPGIDIELCVAQINKLAINFKKIIIFGYPPLLRDLITRGGELSLDWSALNVHLVTAGESMSEAWRDHINAKLGGDKNRIVNLYGLAETGAVAAETPLMYMLRSLLADNLPDFLGGTRTIGIHQYFPESRYFESDDQQRLIVTTDSGIPLIRYDTKDHGLIIPVEELSQHLSTQQRAALGDQLGCHQEPLLCMFGREDLSATFYALNVYPESIRSALDSLVASRGITGRFVMQAKYRDNMSQLLEIAVELSPETQATEQLATEIGTIILAQLLATNTEYRELHDKLGAQALPEIQLKAYGTIGYIAGKKHKWVKRG